MIWYFEVDLGFFLNILLVSSMNSGGAAPPPPPPPPPMPSVLPSGIPAGGIARVRNEHHLHLILMNSKFEAKFQSLISLVLSFTQT